MDLDKNRLPERVVKNQFLGVPLGNLKDIGTIITTNQSKIRTLKGYLSYIVIIVFTLGQVGFYNNSFTIFIINIS